MAILLYLSKKTMVPLLAAVAFAGGACSNFLEPKSQSEFSPTQIDQLNELIVSGLPGPSDPDRASLTGGFLDILTDDVETTPSIQPGNETSDLWYRAIYIPSIYALYTWQPNYSHYVRDATGGAYIDQIYTNTYRKLVYVNSALDYIDKVSGSAAMKQYVKAQALALRAFYYLNLVNVYGAPYPVDPNGPGIPLRLTGAKENRPMSRNTVGEVYAQIVNDLRESIDLFTGLESIYQYRQNRPTLPMALLLLSRTYLYMEEWEQAETTAQKLIADWQQFQVKNLEELVNAGTSNVHANAGNASATADEKRIQKFYHFISYDNPDVIWAYGAAADIANLTGKDLTSGTSTVIIKNDVRATMTRASDNLIGTYHANDLRLRTYLVRSLFYEPDYKAGAAFNPADLKYRAYGKMLISTSVDGIPTTSYPFLPDVGSFTYGQALRITEAYLIAAEAQAMRGKNAEALQTLTTVMEKRFAGGTVPASYTAGDLIERVREERRREFCFEALRWFDLRRWGMPKIEHKWYEVQAYRDLETYTLSAGDAFFTLPIPHTVLEKNPALTQEQGGARKPARTEQKP